MTTAQYVTVILDRYDGAGNPVVQGTATWTPSQDLPDPADTMLVGMGPVTAVFRAGSLPTVRLIANDSIGPQQEDGTPGWTWNLSYTGVPGSPAAASYYVITANGSTQYLSELAPTPAAQPGGQYVPLPNTPPADDTLVLGLSSSSPLVTEWVAGSGGGGGSGTVTTISVATANGFAGTVANPTTTPAVTVKTSVTGLLKGNGTAVAAATAGTDYVAPAGSGAALTGITATQVGADASGAAATAQSNAETFATAAVATETSRAETAEALALQLTGGTMSGAIAMGSHKVTGLTNGSLSTDAAAFGQIPTALPPNGSAGGDLSGSYPNPTLLKVNGSVTSGQYARGNGSAVVLSAIQAADVPTLNQSTSGNAATATTAAACSGNAATATNLAGAATFPAEVSPTVTTLTFVGSGTTLVNAALGNVFALTLTASTTTLGNPSNPVDGQPIRVRIIQDATGSRTLAYGTAWDFGAAGAPTLSTAANAIDYLAGEYNATKSKWCVSAALGY